jgi:DNA repair protein RadC
MKTVKSIDPPNYKARGPAEDEDAVIARALAILAGRVRKGPIFDSPTTTQQFVQLQLAEREHEVFAVIFIDAGHRLIAFEEMFRGTLRQTSVYPREIVKRALELNAGVVLLVHNHPSGSLEPSAADKALTQTLKAALALVDVRVLDHLIVSCTGYTSFAERGLL